MPSDTLRRIGSRIRELRKAGGYTLDELSERISLSSGKYLGQIERGEINCTIETLEKIADGLGVRLEDLFYREDDAVITGIVDVVRARDRKVRERVLNALKALFG